jgi:hypothetical protein
VRLADGDLGALETGTILGGQRPERPARIEHHHRQGLEFALARKGERGGDDGLGIGELHGWVLVCAWLQGAPAPVASSSRTHF